MLHRTRHLFVRQQTSVINAIRAHMAEFGIVARVGRNGVEELLAVAADPADRRLPEVAEALAQTGVQMRESSPKALARAGVQEGRHANSTWFLQACNSQGTCRPLLDGNRCGFTAPAREGPTPA